MDYFAEIEPVGSTKDSDFVFRTNEHGLRTIDGLPVRVENGSYWRVMADGTSM